MLGEEVAHGTEGVTRKGALGWREALLVRHDRQVRKRRPGARDDEHVSNELERPSLGI